MVPLKVVLAMLVLSRVPPVLVTSLGSLPVLRKALLLPFPILILLLVRVPVRVECPLRVMLTPPVPSVLPIRELTCYIGPRPSTGLRGMRFTPALCSPLNLSRPVLVTLLLLSPTELPIMRLALGSRFSIVTVEADPLELDLFMTVIYRLGQMAKPVLCIVRIGPLALAAKLTVRPWILSSGLRLPRTVSTAVPAPLATAPSYLFRLGCLVSWAEGASDGAVYYDECKYGDG